MSFLARCAGPTIRRGQIITTFGPGAIVNFENGSFIGMSIDGWPSPTSSKTDVIYDERLQARLRVSFFRQPPTAAQMPRGLPYRRFPRWLFCSNLKCRMLNTVQDWLTNPNRRYVTSQPTCRGCGKKPLVPVGILVACRKGHIDDFPWLEWAHKGKPICAGKADLKFRRGGGGVGLGGFIVICNKCGVQGSLRGAFSPDAFDNMGLKCEGSRPWSKALKDATCGERLHAVQRGGSNVYFPKTVSSISIPPYTDDLFERMRQSGKWLALSTAVFEGDTSGIDDALKDLLIKGLANELGESIETINAAVSTYLQTVDPAKSIARSDEQYRYEEYQAFHGNYDKSRNNRRDFEIEETDVPDTLKRYGIQKMTLVHSLREVRALIGFSRLRPFDEEEGEKITESSAEASVIVSVADKKIPWRPAMEVRGEGIFITLDEQRIQEWSERKKVKERCAQLNSNWQKHCKKRKVEFHALSPRYLLIHSLAHLIIRQLSYESGYSSASLRERIYCEKHETGGKMNGFLIYTAAGDADGTLGGLVRQARPDRFPQLFADAIENSRWCSTDPLCSESHGQGYESLNLAACYACMLLSETSCEEYNKLLDRALVVGLPQDPSIGFMTI